MNESLPEIANPAPDTLHYSSAGDLMRDLVADASDDRSPVIIGVEDFSSHSLIELRDVVAASLDAPEHLVMPFGNRIITMERLLAELGQRLRASGKFSMASAAILPVPDAIDDLFRPREDKLYVVIQHADRMPIEMFRHIAGALARIDSHQELGAHFVLGVSPGFFDSVRGEIILQAVRPDRITSNEILTQDDVRKGHRRRVVPHPADNMVIDPAVPGRATLPEPEADPVFREAEHDIEVDSISLHGLIEESQDIVDLELIDATEAESSQPVFALDTPMAKQSWFRRIFTTKAMQRHEPVLPEEKDSSLF